ncbi:MAG: TRAP transporter large permease subunit [Desulfovibrio sp.]|nr:MAG: TRAP transporter large permease subunit [Desulfovibrio sp.]
MSGNKILLLVLVLLGAPLFAVIGAAALYGFHSDGMDLMLVAFEVFNLVETPVLVAIPLFTFAGELMGRANTSQRLVAVSRGLVGWMPGGLGVVTILVCAAFTALTGASGVTIVALGALLYPALVSDGYPERFSLGLVTSSGSLGLLFPPAIPLILYAIIAGNIAADPSQASLDTLFLAGILPGLLMVVLLAAYSIYQGVRRKAATQPFSWSVLGKAMWAAKWELPLPVVILGGIYSGLIALSEAAAVTAFYTLIVETCIYREVGWKDLMDVMKKSMTLVGGILIILALSRATTNFMIDQGVPDMLFDLAGKFFTSKWSFLLALNIFLLILGAILDIFSAIVLVVPLILPVAEQYGVHPAHLGVIFLANMEIGYCTPPVGLNLFISSYRFKKPILGVARSTIPFLLILALVVVLATYWSDLSLFLPRLFLGP